MKSTVLADSNFMPVHKYYINKATLTKQQKMPSKAATLFTKQKSVRTSNVISRIIVAQSAAKLSEIKVGNPKNLNPGSGSGLIMVKCNFKP